MNVRRVQCLFPQLCDVRCDVSAGATAFSVTGSHFFLATAESSSEDNSDDEEGEELLWLVDGIGLAEELAGRFLAIFGVGSLWVNTSSPLHCASSSRTGDGLSVRLPLVMPLLFLRLFWLWPYCESCPQAAVEVRRRAGCLNVERCLDEDDKVDWLSSSSSVMSRIEHTYKKS